MKWFQEIFEGFEERMRNIAAFFPILELNQKTKYPYPPVPLGVAIMLYVLEDMLRGKKDCTYEKIAYFLQDLINSKFKEKITYDLAIEITQYLVREGLMNRGRPHTYTYPDLQTGAEKSHKFHLLELEEYQIKDKIVRLKLSTDGLELLFKTKELYNELQVSITQLYLRQQIQKGVFDGALRSVEELSLAVKNEKNKIKKLQERIIRDVLQVAREQELEKQIDRINEQLNREKKVFAELEELIEYTMEQLNTGSLTEKEEIAINKVMQIKRKLLDVISEHESLFTDKIRIQKLMNQSIESMIISAFNTKVNFETEFLRPVVQKNLSMDILKKVLDPILPIKRRPFFHPGRVFLEQPLKTAAENNLSEQELWELEEELIRREEEKELQQQLERERDLEAHLLMLLRPLIQQQEVKISELMEDISKSEPDKFQGLINKMNFYPLLIQLHQLGKIPILASWELETYSLDDLPRVLVKIAGEHPDIHGLNAVELVATGEVIYLPNGYVMSDFIVTRRDKDGMA
ncbi:hypothetical protein [Desulforamulus aquiferis]|uniref:Uncharacterized protein n=1 Tax=Desulforamulus aquiferis TaxID=1397668 RepID=A0AAW7ZCC9_9FIRM|nr:hypothetical protein [Desulforamulus aquiferis]MDO7786879.1 hypothetical protein [Desulforamulus aquiferis]